MSSQSRGVSHLEEVLPLNALQEAMEHFIDQYHVSFAHPTRQWIKIRHFVIFDVLETLLKILAECLWTSSISSMSFFKPWPPGLDWVYHVGAYENSVYKIASRVVFFEFLCPLGHMPKSLVDEYRRPSITSGANYVLRDANFDEILIRALNNARKLCSWQLGLVTSILALSPK